MITDVAAETGVRSRSRSPRSPRRRRELSKTEKKPTDEDTKEEELSPKKEDKEKTLKKESTGDSEEDKVSKEASADKKTDVKESKEHVATKEKGIY